MKFFQTRASWIVALALASSLLMGACSDDESPRTSSDCGACSDGEVCGEDGLCGPSVTCTDTCSSLGAVCGEVCGEVCGACVPGAVCREGACECQPTCLQKTCGAPDGCGSTCEPCPSDHNCEDCMLRVHVLERTYDEGRLDTVTIAVDYKPETGAALPGIADLRFDLVGPARVIRAGIDKRHYDRGKTLHRDGLTGEAWTMLGPERLQLLLLSREGNERLDAGRLAVFKLKIGSAEEPALTPVVLTLLEREQIFAPQEADEALWTSKLAEPISIWPEVGHE